MISFIMKRNAEESAMTSDKGGQGGLTMEPTINYEKQIATNRLLSELFRGAESLEKESGLTIDEAFDGLDN